MLGISEIGKNSLAQGTKSMPAFGSAYSPSFGNTTYHDEFVSSHNDGVTAKQIGLFALIGAGIAAVVALAFRKPSAATAEAAEEVEKIVEYKMAGSGTAGKVLDFITAKNWRAERRVRLDAIKKETAEAGVAEVPSWLRRAARFVWIPNRFGESSAVLKGRKIAEEALNKEIKAAERIADAPIREAEALAKAGKIEDKARVAKAKADAEVASRERKAAKAKPTSSTPTGSDRPHHRGSLTHLTEDRETVLTKARERAEATEIEAEPKRGFFRKVGGGIAYPFKKIGQGAHWVVSSDYRAECKAAREAAAEEARVSLKDLDELPGDFPLDPPTPAPELTSVDAASKTVKQIAEGIKDVELSTAETNFLEATISKNKKYLRTQEAYKDLSDAEFEAEFNNHWAPNKSQLINSENKYIDSLISRNEAKVNYGESSQDNFGHNFSNEHLEYIQAYAKPKGYKVVIEKGEIKNTIAVNLEKI